ncbi:hypothetical protein [Streptomyces griseosporeus]
MDQLAIAEWGLAGAAVVYAVLGVAARVRRRAHDRLSASLTDFEVDPYLAVATTLGLDEVDRAAAAALIVDGMAGIDSENRITLTERGAKSKSTPQHPVPAALLKALRRMRTPAYLRRLRDESGYRERRDDFLSRQRARTPAWPAAHRTDTLFRTGVLALTALSLFYAVQVVWLARVVAEGWREFPHWLLSTPLLGLLIAVPLVLPAVAMWNDAPDAFRQHCTRLPEHPALHALSRESRCALLRSQTPKEASVPPRLAWYDTGTDTF